MIKSKSFPVSALGYLIIMLFVGMSASAVAADNIRVLSGGVGVGERLERNPAYSTKFVFSKRSTRGLLANIHIVISQDKGKKKILETTSFGPWLFVDLPPGTYDVKGIREDGKIQSAKFSISGSRQRRVEHSW